MRNAVNSRSVKGISYLSGYQHFHFELYFTLLTSFASCDYENLAVVSIDRDSRLCFVIWTQCVFYQTGIYFKNIMQIKFGLKLLIEL
jgi:hypothetical protein